MQQAHIRSRFDVELEAVQARVMKLGGLVEAALLDAAEALEQRDQTLADRVRLGDAACKSDDSAHIGIFH